MNIYENYANLLERKKELDEEIIHLQCRLYEMHQEKLDEKDTGTINVIDSEAGYKLTVVKRENIKVNQDLASVIGVGFKKKYTLDTKAYKALPNEEKKRVDECLTVVPGKPSFKVETL